MFSDLLSYVPYKDVMASTLHSGYQAVKPFIFREETTAKIPPALASLPVSKVVLTGNPFVKLAGVSGAAAVILGAYGAHCIYVKEGQENQKRIYQTANFYHFIHTLALLGVPLCKYPKAAGSLFTAGILLFSGTCYCDAFYGVAELRKFTPIGGSCFIIGWLCLLL